MTAHSALNHARVDDDSQRHIPVLLEEVIVALDLSGPKAVIDGTFGAGGYTRAILERGAGSRVMAIDRDPDAIAAGSSMVAKFAGRLTLVHGPFGQLGEWAGEHPLLLLPFTPGTHAGKAAGVGRATGAAYEEGAAATAVAAATAATAVTAATAASVMSEGPAAAARAEVWAANQVHVSEAADRGGGADVGVGVDEYVELLLAVADLLGMPPGTPLHLAVPAATAAVPLPPAAAAAAARPSIGKGSTGGGGGGSGQLVGGVESHLLIWQHLAMRSQAGGRPVELHICSEN